jgi:hypothetical protein
MIGAVSSTIQRLWSGANVASMCIQIWWVPYKAPLTANVTICGVPWIKTATSWI